jgi:hypothetical protein
MLRFLQTGRSPLAGVPAVPLLLAASLVIAFALAIVRSLSPPPAALDIFASAEVTAAPVPTLATNGSSEFSDVRGGYNKLVFPGDGAGKGYVNVAFTRKGGYRSGDLHKCDQVNLMVVGEAVLTTLRGAVKKDQVVRAGELVVTPAGVPHLFHFVQDSTMTEHWVDATEGGKLCAFAAWYYKPFRDVVEESMRKAGSGGGGEVNVEVDV